MEYLGHIISNEGLSVDTQKVKAVMEWPTPKSKQHVQSFLGFVSYYRKFIKNCSLLAKPLTELTKNVKFEWGKPQEESFQTLKNSICTAPVLRTFDVKLPIFVTTDASQYAIGAVIEQEEYGK